MNETDPNQCIKVKGSLYNICLTVPCGKGTVHSYIEADLSHVFTSAVIISDNLGP